MKIIRNLLIIGLASVMCGISASVYAVIGDNDIKDDWDKDETTVIGDLDGDGKVTTDDLIIMRKYIAGIIGSSEFDFNAGDMDDDGSINTDDLILLRKKIAGLY